MNCSLIICTYNWPDALKLVLLSAISQNEAPNEIIVADDGSEESTAKVIEEVSKKTPIPIMHSWQEDLGCRIPHSRNRAISKSNFEYIIMIDGDTVLHSDFVKDHKRFAKKGLYVQGSRALLQLNFTNNVLMNQKFESPKFFSKDTKNKINLLRVPFLTWVMSFYKNKNINRIRGCNYSIHKDDIIKVNGFNEEFITWGREDSEFVQRLFNFGLKKIHIKFSGLQYHLFHFERSNNEANNEILKNTIKKNETWCRLGIDSYINSNKK